MKKIMIISDIHGSYDDLKKVISLYNKHHCEQLIILGDILYHGPRNDLPKGYNPKKCIALLNEYKNDIIAVRGNCDAEVDQMVFDFPIGSDYLLYNIDGVTFFITHGHLYNEDNFTPLHKGDVYLYGHFHVPVFEKYDGYYKVNPSSISLPKEGEKSFLIYENRRFTRYNLEDFPLNSYRI